jgi:hypothetical protein
MFAKQWLFGGTIDLAFWRRLRAKEEESKEMMEMKGWTG